MGGKNLFVAVSCSTYGFGKSPTPEKAKNEAKHISWDSLNARVSWTNFKVHLSN